MSRASQPDTAAMQRDPAMASCHFSLSDKPPNGGNTQGLRVRRRSSRMGQIAFDDAARRSLVVVHSRSVDGSAAFSYENRRLFTHDIKGWSREGRRAGMDSGPLAALETPIGKES